MAQPATHTPPALVRYVPTTFPMAVQAIAALEERVALLRTSGEEWALIDAHAALASLRAAFDLWPSEAQLDAAHEAAMHAMSELAEADVPLALDSYWNRGA